MTDTLRDRIAAAAASELVLQAKAAGEYQTRDCFKVADAVIAALGLRRDPITPQVAALLYGDFRKPMHRYVTEWAADQ